MSILITCFDGEALDKWLFIQGPWELYHLQRTGPIFLFPKYRFQSLQFAAMLMLSRVLAQHWSQYLTQYWTYIQSYLSTVHPGLQFRNHIHPQHQARAYETKSAVLSPSTCCKHAVYYTSPLFLELLYLQIDWCWNISLELLFCPLADSVVLFSSLWEDSSSCHHGAECQFQIFQRHGKCEVREARGVDRKIIIHS